MRTWRPIVLIAALTAAAPLPISGQDLPTVAHFVRDLEVVEGPVRLYMDPTEGRVYLSVEGPGEPLAHIVALSRGLDWPIDTGAMPWDGSTAILDFDRGDGVVHVSEQGRPPEQPPRSHDLPIVAADSSAFLVDATAFFVRDAFNVARDLGDVGATVTFDAARSEVVWPAPLESAFSTNLDVRTTFHVAGSSRWVEDRSVDPGTVSVVQRHMLLPAPSGFVPRRAPEGAGFITIPAGSQDPAAGPQPGWIQRWRIGGIRTLVVSIAGSVPEEHRAAVQEGIAYWRRAFNRSALPVRIQIEDLPDDSDALALEHPVVFMWSQRRQPMASQGHVAVDPRSGETLKAVVLIDALWPSVARNEYRSYRSALAPGAPSEADYVAARLAWVVAHEAGHALAGLLHTGVRETAVGFRVPQLRATGGRVELDIGSLVPTDPTPYDLWSLEYAYRTWPDHQDDSLQALQTGGVARGLRHIGYETRRLMPETTSRIAGVPVVTALREAVAARSVLLDHFGPSALDPGEPRARLYERLVPVYFHHRFAIEGVARVVAGLRYGADGESLRVIPASEQWEALEQLVDVLAPAALQIPARVIRAMPAMPDSADALVLRGESGRTDIYTFQTGDSYPIDLAIGPGAPFTADPWAQALAEITIGAALDPVRVSRLEAQAVDDPSLPSLGGVIERLVDRIWWAEPSPQPAGTELQRVVRRVLIEHLVDLARGDSVSPSARATIHAELVALADRLSLEGTVDPEEVELIRDAVRVLDRTLGMGHGVGSGALDTRPHLP